MVVNVWREFLLVFIAGGSCYQSFCVIYAATYTNAPKPSHWVWEFTSFNLHHLSFGFLLSGCNWASKYENCFFVLAIRVPTTYISSYGTNTMEIQIIITVIIVGLYKKKKKAFNLPISSSYMYTYTFLVYCIQWTVTMKLFVGNNIPVLNKTELYPPNYTIYQSMKLTTY